MMNGEYPEVDQQCAVENDEIQSVIQEAAILNYQKKQDRQKLKVMCLNLANLKNADLNAQEIVERAKMFYNFVRT